MKTKLPTIKDKFHGGGSLSAIQVDGVGEPRRAKVWQDYLYERYPERHWSGIGPLVAIDFTRRYKEDIAFYQQIGINSIRYGFQGARLFPDGIKLNASAVQYYHEVLDAFHAAKIDVIMQLVHFDSPMGVKELGGGQNAEVQRRFQTFARFVFKEYGAKVEYFATFNEPAVMKGMLGEKEWGIDEKPSLERTYRECFGLIKCNALAYYEILDLRKSKQIRKDVKLGVVVNYNKAYAGEPEHANDPKIQQAIKYCDAFNNLFGTDALVKGVINQDVKEAFSSQGFKLPITPEEEAFISKVDLDFIGENYYLPGRVKAVDKLVANPTNPEQNLFTFKPGAKARMNHFRGGEIFPEGLTGTLMDLGNRYHKPMYIGENGMGVDNEERFRTKDGMIFDDYRISYIKEHLIALKSAIDQGATIFGYHAWSMTDLGSSYNGFKNRYGFIEINLNNNLERRLKLSAYGFKDFIVSGEIKHDFTPCEKLTAQAMQDSLRVMSNSQAIGKQNYELILKGGKKDV